MYNQSISVETNYHFSSVLGYTASLLVHHFLLLLVFGFSCVSKSSMNFRANAVQCMEKTYPLSRADKELLQRTEYDLQVCFLNILETYCTNIISKSQELSFRHGDFDLYVSGFDLYISACQLHRDLNLFWFEKYN